MAKVEIPLASIEAAIFDMDGTMINNMAYHQKAWQEYLRRHGIELDEAEFKAKISGKKNDQIFEIVFGHPLGAEELALRTEEKESLYQELYAPNIIEVAGLTTVIDELHRRGIKTAIATTAPAGNRNFGLAALGMQDKFEVILGDEHVTHGKPDPEIYLKTAEQLGVEPAQCIVFEDSPPGVESAKRAGMTVVGILTSHMPEELPDVDYVVNDFSEIIFV